ncbi:MAG: FecR domain-containing protein [Prolixibacteraceae bacterium]|jgi:ferric-dicitrate binding protein FerR (iron transport regulator)|nr:FecR domain-containing protein [Prolixibacteraceae bacterium]
MEEKGKKYQSTQGRIDQAIRHYRVPSRLDSESALNLVLSKIENSQTSPKTVRMTVWWNYAGTAAAVLFIGLLLHILLSTVTYEGSSSQIVVVRLPDQSRVVVNQNSRIEIRKYLWNRQVLLRGNAYFEVEKGSRFVVSTASGKVEVLGTRFSVNENDNRLDVACFEGKVKASNRGMQQILEAGDAVSVYDGKREPSRISAGYPGFAMFSKHYSNAELADVVEDIDRFFGVKTTVISDEQRFFTGTLETGNLETALTIITGSLQMDYTIDGKNRVQINQSIN